MKKLLAAYALLLCFTAQAQNSFMLKSGSELTYKVTEGDANYTMVVKVLGTTPGLEFDYKSSDGGYKGNLRFAASSDKLFYYNYFVDGIDLSGTGAAIYLQKPLFDKLNVLGQNSKKGITADTTKLKIWFDWTAPPVLFGNAKFEKQEVLVNGKTISMETVACTQIVDSDGKKVAPGTGYSIKVNNNSSMPIVTFVNDTKGKFSITLIEAKEVDAN